MPKLTCPKLTWAFFKLEPKSVIVKLASLPLVCESAKRLAKCSISEFLLWKANSFNCSRYYKRLGWFDYEIKPRKKKRKPKQSKSNSV